MRSSYLRVRARTRFASNSSSATVVTGSDQSTPFNNDSSYVSCLSDRFRSTFYTDFIKTNPYRTMLVTHWRVLRLPDGRNCEKGRGLLDAGRVNINVDSCPIANAPKSMLDDFHGDNFHHYRHLYRTRRILLTCTPPVNTSRLCQLYLLNFGIVK